MGLLDALQMPLPQSYSKLGLPMRAQVREQYIKKQNGLCQHCGNPLDGSPTEDIQDKRVSTHLFPENFFDHPVHLHHDHITDLTIGAVHAKCNAVLWEYHGE